MSFYENTVLPFVIDMACSTQAMMEYRQKIVPYAKGEVLEVGMGSALNLKLYDTSLVDFVWGLEPSEGMRKRAQKNLRNSPVDVKWLGLRGEDIPLPDNSIDSIVLTYTLCTIPDATTALQQMYRVLKPGGQLLFCEHGLSPEPKVQAWQHRLTPMWKKVCGGCHLNRPVTDYLTTAGFNIAEVHNEYIDKAPHFVGYMYYGIANK